MHVPDVSTVLKMSQGERWHCSPVNAHMLVAMYMHLNADLSHASKCCRLGMLRVVFCCTS